ncbi:MAG: hypothetical protein IT294_08730 [Deltaproteobacteria bacterium]|nr:hypothetical protein [Deltaproteobacteria bacterium]
MSIEIPRSSRLGTRLLFCCSAVALTLASAAAVFAENPPHNLGATPPACTTAQMMQDNGQFPPAPYGPPGCLLPGNAGVAITEAQATYDGQGFFRLDVAATKGAVTRNGTSYPVTSVVIWNYFGNRGGPFEWTPGDGVFELSPNIEYRNPDGSGGGGDVVGICAPPCKLLFRPVSPEAHWFRVTVEGYAPGAGSYGFHAAASTIVQVPELPKVHANLRVTNVGGKTMRFDASASTGNIERYQFFFGDNTSFKIGPDTVVDHEYAATGKFNVMLYVYGESGTIDWVMQEIEVGSKLSLAVTATPPEPQGVHSGETVHYTLDADAAEKANDLVVTATIRPDLVLVDESSITQGGVLADDTITWTLADTSGTNPALAFDATVKPFLPDTILFIPLQAHAHATFADASVADADGDGTVTYLKSNLTVLAEADLPREDHVLPEDEIRYRVAVEAKTEADEIVLEAPIPTGTTFVPGSITENGVQTGDKITWTFTDVDHTPTLSYKVKVVALKKLPKDLDRVTAKMQARGDFDGAKEQGSNTLETELVRPTDLRGVVRDIVFQYPKRWDLATPPLANVEVRLLDGGGAELDTTTTDAKGKFNLQLGKAGNYQIEARALGDVYSAASNSIDQKGRMIRALHTVKLDDDKHLFVDGVELARDAKGVPALFDAAYVPLSLVRRASELLSQLHNFRIDYLFLVRFDLGPLFGDLAHYDVAKMTELLDAAIALEGFINHDGTLAHFHGLYRGSGDKDGWNALVRACAYMVQLDLRAQEAVRLIDALGKTVALAATTQFISNVLPKMTPRWKGLLGGRTTPPLEGSAAMMERAIKTGKIGGMAFGVGVGLPHILEAFGIKGSDKAEWIEVIAKGLRYGANLLANKYLPGALREDITFEEIFNVMRIGIDIAGIERYIAATQESPDNLAGLLKLGVYGGDTFQAYGVLDTISDRVAQRTQNFLTGFAAVLADISIIRGADGVLGVGSVFLKAPTDPTKRFAAAKAWFKGSALGAMNNIKKASKWAVPIQYTLVIGGIVNELIVRTGDIVKIEAAAFNAAALHRSGPDEERRGLLASLPQAPEGLPRAVALRATKFKPPKLPKTPPTAELDAYLAVLARVQKAVGKGDATAYDADRLALVAAHDGLFAPLDVLYDRAALAFPLVAADTQVSVLSFLEARNSFAQTASDAYSLLEGWVEAPTDSDVKGGMKKVLKLLPTRAIEANAFFPAATQVIDKLTIPGGLVVHGGNEPDTAAVLAGTTFAMPFVIANPGDGATDAAVAELIPGDALELVSDATQTVPALAAGEAVELTWQLKTLPASPVGFSGNVQILVRRDGAIVANGSENVVEFDPVLSLP